MKKVLKKSLVLLLAMVMAVSCLVACGKDEVGGGEITVFYGGVMPTKDQEAAQETLDRLAGMADFPFKWETGDQDSIKLAFNSGDYPDVVLTGTYMSSLDVVKYASSGILIPLDEYINEKDTPNIYKMFEEYPTAKGIVTLDDGHIYSLPSVSDFTAAYFETAFYINKAWLDKLGLKVPTTLDELYTVLKAFKTEDPNGNGKQDEIPMSFYNNAGYSYPEVLLSAYGMSAKHGTWDQFLSVDNGKVEFAPVTEEWKKLIKYYNKLYSEGLLDMECLTQNQSTFDAKAGAATSQVGFLWTNANIMGAPDEYITIPPLSAEGNTPVLHIHPAAVTKASVNAFEITNKCEDPAAVMRWIDKFYEMDTTFQNTYGNVGRTLTIDENGKYVFNEPANGDSQGMMITKNQVVSWPKFIKEAYFNENIEMTEVQQQQAAQFAIYKDYIDPEIWPRPYYSLEDADEISILTTDLFRLVEEKKAKWIVGKADIDAEWDTYIKDLEAIGLEKLLKISQKTYDNYLKNQK
jgi:putative aldouronate transport system substrate-binding protein